MTGNDVSLAMARRLQALGIDEVLPRDISTGELRQSIRDLIGVAARGVGGTERPEGIILSFAQARGGIGATTIAVNVAQALARMKPEGRRGDRRKVVVVDLDIQFGNVAVLCDVEDNGGLIKLIESPELPDATFMRSVVQHHASGLDIVAAPVTVAPLTAMRASSITAMLDALKSQYDYIIVDLPRALVEWIEPVLQRSDRLCLVTDTSVPCIRQSRRMMDFFREANAGLKVELIVNRETKPLIAGRHIREAEQAMDAKFGHWLPDNPKAARRSADLGHPIVSSAARSDLGRSLLSLAQKFESTLSLVSKR
jgi:Flp pilus assembly CpaE family ATPase